MEGGGGREGGQASSGGNATLLVVQCCTHHKDPLPRDCLVLIDSTQQPRQRVCSRARHNILAQLLTWRVQRQC